MVEVEVVRVVGVVGVVRVVEPKRTAPPLPLHFPQTDVLLQDGGLAVPLPSQLQ